MEEKVKENEQFDDEWIDSYAKENRLQDGEIAVLRAIMHGYTNNDDIAYKLGVTTNSVKHRLVMIYARTGAKDKPQLVLSVLRHHFNIKYD